MSIKDELQEKLQTARDELEKVLIRVETCEQEYKDAKERYRRAENTLRLWKMGVEKALKEKHFYERVLRELK